MEIAVVRVGGNWIMGWKRACRYRIADLRILWLRGTFLSSNSIFSARVSSLFYLSVCVPVYVCVYVSVCLSASLSVCLSVSSCLFFFFCIFSPLKSLWITSSHNILFLHATPSILSYLLSLFLSLSLTLSLSLVFHSTLLI